MSFGVEDWDIFVWIGFTFFICKMGKKYLIMRVIAKIKWIKWIAKIKILPKIKLKNSCSSFDLRDLDFKMYKI